MSDFLILDGHALIYRACHASQQRLTSPSGEPTNGPYFFTKTLFSLVQERKPAYLAMAADPPKTLKTPLARKKLYPAYKQDREGQPEEIFVQVQRCLDIASALGVPVLVEPGQEADDVIATLAWKALEFDEFEGKAIIVSRDKDMHQLLSAELVEMYDPFTRTFVTEADVERRWGCTEWKVAHVQALCGDPTDSIPGVKGIGEVRARKLMADQPDGIHSLMLSLRTLPPSVAGSLRKAWDSGHLRTMMALTTLNRDLWEINLEDYTFKGLDVESARPIFNELGFTRWTKRKALKR